MAKTPEKKKLTVELTKDQLKALQPILDNTGSVELVGSIEGSTLKIALLACQTFFTPDLKIQKK